MVRTPDKLVSLDRDDLLSNFRDGTLSDDLLGADHNNVRTDYVSVVAMSLHLCDDRARLVL